jgi:hypothetical protein
MVYGEADWLNYVMCQRAGHVICHLMDFQKLKASFWEDVDRFRPTTTDQHNRTECRIVPLDWVRQKVGIYVKELQPTPEGRKAVAAFNRAHYKQERDLFDSEAAA